MVGETVYSLMTCRFCKKSGYQSKDFVKYGVRHYAHHRCYLAAGKPLSDLHDWQIGCFPFRAIKDAGLEAEAQAAYDREHASGAA